MRDAEKTIGNLIDKQGTVYVSSVDSDGYPNTKAMNSPRKRVGIREFYFSTNTSSIRANQYRKNPKACIYFCDKRFYRGVMLKGTMEVLEDEESKEEIWLPGDTMYYPKGVADPDYCVLKFIAEEGRYYSNFKSQTFDISIDSK
jgi:general stress protein 26